MAETATLDNELKVGTGWRYRCWNCNRQVKIDKPFPKRCPGCGATGWWGHLTPAVPRNNGEKDGDGIKNYSETMPGGIKTQDLILSQLPDAVTHGVAQNEGILEPSQGQGRGRPRQTVPDDLILELAGQGFSSRKMVTELAKRGSPGIGYKTIQRRLQASLL